MPLTDRILENRQIKGHKTEDKLVTTESQRKEDRKAAFVKNKETGGRKAPFLSPTTSLSVAQTGNRLPFCRPELTGLSEKTSQSVARKLPMRRSQPV